MAKVGVALLLLLLLTLSHKLVVSFEYSHTLKIIFFWKMEILFYLYKIFRFIKNLWKLPPSKFSLRAFQQ
jgi:hypothetical protein